jgi:hypothetical protein
VQDLPETLTVATRRIGAEYFSVPIAEGDPVFRERVYCYELYHQMRVLWPANCPWTLNGELDKGGHPILKGLGVDFAKPDLLVHRAGDMNRNHAVIEVKHSLARDGLADDFRKLDLFTHRVGYTVAVLLVYGSGVDSTMRHVQAAWDIANCRGPVELWCHASVGESAYKLAEFG